jgi:hypothetical protein
VLIPPHDSPVVVLSGKQELRLVADVLALMNVNPVKIIHFYYHGN